MIPASIKDYLLLVKYIVLFMRALKLEASSLISQRPLIRFWHDSIIFKLTQNGISANLLSLLSDFLNERKERVVLNSRFSLWKNVSPRVPQASILDLLLFLIYINDLTESISSDAKLFCRWHVFVFCYTWYYNFFK